MLPNRSDYDALKQITQVPHPTPDLHARGAREAEGDPRGDPSGAPGTREKRRRRCGQGRPFVDRRNGTGRASSRAGSRARARRPRRRHTPRRGRSVASALDHPSAPKGAPPPSFSCCGSSEKSGALARASLTRRASDACAKRCPRVKSASRQKIYGSEVRIERTGG